MRSLFAAFSVALMASTAQAQTVIERQVSEDLVETTIMRNPDGSVVVTRQPLSSGTVETIAAPAPIAIEEPAPRVTTRRVTTTVRPTAGTTVRSNRTVVREAPRAQTRTIARETVRTVREPLALTPAQRQIIYRTIVHRDVYAPPARIVAAPVERPLPPALVDSPYTARASALPEPIVGTRVSALDSYAMMPEAVAVQVPAARSYRYMVINNRLLLVDPVTSTVVADITED